ncbi:S1C family serine protease [Ideonella sp. A 288]|uniref:S1C family serine protease n=1 Tax=Ideonella sp. A 288 TaxID=1962181 RepID=UPI000B4BFC03|nr:serine protease [Ideonella sp. A 288]
MRRRDVLLWLAAAASTGPAAALDLADLIEANRGSVVAVGIHNPVKSPRFSFRGTGFVVGDGSRVVTNAHVLPGLSERDVGDRLAVLVLRRPGSPELRLVGNTNSDAVHDVAVLEIEGAPLTAIALSTAGLPRPGTAVALIGYPLGTALGVVPVTHRGIVSAITAIALPPGSARQLDEKTLMRLRDGAFEVLQLDATAYPGNSGSPLFDLGTGQVVGVINMVHVKSTKESALSQPSGITYAVPVRHVTELLERR